MASLMSRADGGNFGDRRDKGGRRVGGPFVDVGRPEMQREKGKLEEKRRHGQGQGQNPQRLGNELWEQPGIISAR